MITILVIARSATVRAGIVALVEADRRFAVAGSFANLAEAVGELEDESLDVTLIESDGAFSEELDELTGSQAEAEIQRSPVVALVADLQTEHIVDLLQRGVRAVLSRNSTSAEILAAIEAVAAGLVVVHPDALYALQAPHAFSEANGSRKSAASAPANGEESLITAEQLTPREVEVLGMLAEGLGNKEIAWRMQISEHTVKFHVSSILGKLGVGSRTEAVTLGLRRGFIML